jgi:hypothetical protein
MRKTTPRSTNHANRTKRANRTRGALARLSLLDVNAPGATGLRLGVPIPQVRQMYSTAEQKTYGLPQHPEVRMPVFRLTF